MCLQENELAHLNYDGDDQEPNQTDSQMMTEYLSIQDLAEDWDDWDWDDVWDVCPED